MRLERLNNLPLNTMTPNFVAIFVFFGTASSFTGRISFLEIQAKLELILFLFGCSEVNSTWIITCGPANQRAPKALFTCVVCTNNKYQRTLQVIHSQMKAMSTLKISTEQLLFSFLCFSFSFCCLFRCCFFVLGVI